MKVTVCEMNDDPDLFQRDWQGLTEHIHREKSELVLLPEMAFYPWFAWKPQFSSKIWSEAVEAHDRWMSRLSDLSPAIVLGTRPVNAGRLRLNEAFVWEKTSDYRTAHSKVYLPDEEGFWENTWYHKSDNKFIPTQVGNIKIGFAICSELWFYQHLQAYGRKGVHLIAIPRATPLETLDKWLAGGRVASVVSGAYSLSSNRYKAPGRGTDLGGQGWISGPDGELLAKTSREKPFLTCDIDPNKAVQAKKTYPRYIPG